MNKKCLIIGIITALVLFFASGYAKLKSKTSFANILFDGLAIQMVSDDYMGDLLYIAGEYGYMCLISFDNDDFDSITFYKLPHSVEEKLASIGSYQYQEQVSSFYLHLDSRFYIDIDSNGIFDIKRSKSQDFIWYENRWLQAYRDDTSQKQFSHGSDIYEFNLTTGKWEIYNENK